MKLIKIGFLIILLGVCSYASNYKYFNLNFKVGMDFNKVETSGQKYYTDPINHYYKPGFSIGLENQIILNEIFRYSSELYYARTYSMYKYVPYAVVVRAYQVFINDNLCLSNTLGLKIGNYFDAYIGIDTKFLIHSVLDILENRSDDFYGRFSRDVTRDINRIENYVCIKISKEFAVRKSKMSLGIKYMESLNRFNNPNFSGKLKNSGIQFQIGYFLI